MYSFFFEPTVLELSIAIYLLGALCLVLGIKLLKAEREIRTNRKIILYVNERLLKLEQEDKQ